VHGLPVIMSVSQLKEFVTSLGNGGNGSQIITAFSFCHDLIKYLCGDGRASLFCMATIYTTFVKGIA
jgi:hypothetical protein